MLVGSWGWKSEAIAASYESEGKPRGIRHLRHLPDPHLAVLYNGARALIFPSFYEGFGLPPLEAMAHGTPVVTSNLSSLPEVVGNAAVLVNPENVFEIMRALHRVLLDQALRERLKELGAGVTEDVLKRWIEEAKKHVG